MAILPRQDTLREAPKRSAVLPAGLPNAAARKPWQRGFQPCAS